MQQEWLFAWLLNRISQEEISARDLRKGICQNRDFESKPPGKLYDKGEKFQCSA